MSKHLTWNLHPPPKLPLPLGRLESEEGSRQGQVSAQGRCRLDPMWVGAAQVLRWECVFTLAGAKRSLRSSLTVSRTPLAAPHPSPKLHTEMLL